MVVCGCFSWCHYLTIYLYLIQQKVIRWLSSVCSSFIVFFTVGVLHNCFLYYCGHFHLVIILRHDWIQHEWQEWFSPITFYCFLTEIRWMFFTNTKHMKSKCCEQLHGQNHWKYPSRFSKNIYPFIFCNFGPDMLCLVLLFVANQLTLFISWMLLSCVDQLTECSGVAFVTHIINICLSYLLRHELNATLLPEYIMSHGHCTTTT